MYNGRLEDKGDKKTNFMNYLARVSNALQYKQKDFIPDGTAGLKQNCGKTLMCFKSHN